MSEPFLGEIRIVAFNFAPRGWAFCDGQILPINQNQALFSLLGTTYGGDGRTSFALPDLRSRTPLHVGSSNGTDHLLGQRGGEELHTLSAAEMPEHDHVLKGTNEANDSNNPLGKHLASSSPAEFYRSPANLMNLSAGTVVNAGGGQSHNNMMTFIVLNFCIALQGLFPSRN
jgi:microcystin-dependent protein